MLPSSRQIRFRAAAAAFGLCVIHAGVAQAQLTAKQLIGYAVDEVGPKHEDVNLAIQKFQKGDVQGTRELLDQATRKDQNLPPADITLAKLYLLARQPPAARATLEKVVRDYPNDPEPLLIFAEQAIGEGQITDARLLLDQVETMMASFTGSPHRAKNFRARLHGNKASLAETIPDWAASVAHLKQMVAEDPDNVAAHNRLGRALFNNGEDREAYVAFTNAAKYGDDEAHADVKIALLYEGKDDRVSAMKFMDRALQNKSSNLQTRLAAVRWLVETQQGNKAKPELDAVLADHPDSVDAHLFAGVVARMLGDNQGALEHLEKAYVLAPQNFDAANQLALFLITQPDEDKRNRAVRYAETNYKLHQNNAEAAISLGWIYYKIGKTRDGVKLINDAVKAGRISADSSYFIAQIFWDRGQSDQAEKLLETALGSKRIFVHRKDAEALLSKIKG